MSTSASHSVRIAVGQLCSSNHKWINIVNLCQGAHQASQNDCRMLFWPENTAFTGHSSHETLQNAEPPLEHEVQLDAGLEQQIVEWVRNGVHAEDDEHSVPSNADVPLVPVLQTLAREAKLWISACVHIQAPPSESDNSPRLYNTQLLLDDAGTIRAVYRKIHLFDLSLPNLVLKESATTAPGHNVVVCNDTPLGRIGLTTCYDVRFPELYLKLAEKGATTLLIPAAFTAPTGEAHWHLLTRTRAVEFQCWVIAAAQCGKHNDKRVSYGHSIVVDPWGKIALDMGSTKQNIIECVDVDLERINRVRERLPVREHRRQAQYE